MKNIIYLIFIAVIAYGAYSYFSSRTKINIYASKDDDSFVTMKNGNVKGEFTKIGNFEINLRVFGVNLSPPTSGPFALMTNMIVATPRADANAIFKKFLCEKNAAGQASVIELIINDSENQSRIKNLAEQKGRRCAYLSGTSYHLDHLFIDGNELVGLNARSTPNSDPFMFIKVSEIKGIPCDQ